MATNTSYSQLTEAKTSPPSLSSHSQKLQEIEIKPASWACTWPSNSGAGSLSSVISSTQRLEKREGLWGLWRQQALVWDCRRKHQTWVQVPGPPYPLLLWELVTEATLYFILGGGSYTSPHYGKVQMSPLTCYFTFILTHCLKATLHLQSSQNTGYTPRIVQHICVAYFTPDGLQLPLPPMLPPSLVTTSLFSVSLPLLGYSH